VLASLLPGLRDLRGPLAVGYTWLIVLWLFFADKVPHERPANGNAIAKLFDLGDLLGPTVVLAAVSFVAYMLGSFMFLDTGGALISSLQRFVLRTPTARRTRLELRDWAREHDLPSRYLDAIFRGTEIRRLEAKLRVANADIYGDFDRLKAEAELRLNVAPAIIALSIALGLELAWYYMFGIGLAFALAWQGLLRLRAGQEVILQALMAEIFTVKALDEDRVPPPDGLPVAEAAP
jgi:hypothetical protein